LVLILVLVKFFVLFLLDGSSLQHVGLKLTLMGLLGDIMILLCTFHGSMRDFIGVFSAFLEVHTAMVVEFYGVIHAMEEAQKMGLTNVWL